MHNIYICILGGKKQRNIGYVYLAGYQFFQGYFAGHPRITVLQ